MTDKKHIVKRKHHPNPPKSLKASELAGIILAGLQIHGDSELPISVRLTPDAFEEINGRACPELRVTRVEVTKVGYSLGTKPKVFIDIDMDDTGEE